MKLNPLVMMRTEFDGTGIVFDPELNKALTLNRTGVAIWQAVEKELPEQKIVKEIISRFKVDDSTAAKDVASFLAVLRKKGLLAE